MANSKILSVRIPDPQLIVVRARALTEGKALATWIREAAVRAALQPPQPNGENRGTS